MAWICCCSHVFSPLSVQNDLTVTEVLKIINNNNDILSTQKCILIIILRRLTNHVVLKKSYKTKQSKNMV